MKTFFALGALLVALSEIGAHASSSSQNLRGLNQEEGMKEHLLFCGNANKECPGSVLQAIEDAGGTITGSYPLGLVFYQSKSDLSIKVNGASITGTPTPAASNFMVEVGDAISFDEVNATDPGDRRLNRRINGVTYPPDTGDDDFFHDLQWFHNAVRSRDAWEKGQRGAGVKVAVLDTGLDYDHPDLAPNLNRNLSTSFVPGEPREYMHEDKYSHASHVAGIIAAADNGYGVIGVAPEAELIHVKVLSDYGNNDFSYVIAGILYAADIGVDIINMSLGAMKQKKECDEDGNCDSSGKSLAELRVAVCRAIDYAHRRGVTVIVSAGNEGFDFNSKEGGQIVNLNGACQKAISISATGPHGWAVDPAGTDLYQPVTYSNYGVGSASIDFAGPGGTYEYYFVDPSRCTIAGQNKSCYRFDYVFSTGNRGWFRAIGTSMAAPAAAGVAALIIGENGGPMNPVQVKKEMKNRALDLGKKGRDEIYGFGHVSSGY